jgi:antibiotic biosynthesis monooxygenase (ABM) superfamily enzyme
MQMLRSVETLPGREYTIIARFESLEARRAFTASPFYADWMERLALLSEGSPSVRELTGIAGLFPSGHGPTPPPKWKMAVTVWVGVFTFGQVFYIGLNPWIGPWPRMAQSAFVSAIVVALLTWVVLPAATRLLHRWYFGNKDG